MLGIVACDKNRVPEKEKSSGEVVNASTKEIPTTVAYANWVDDTVHFEEESYTLKFNQTKQLKLYIDNNTRVKKNIRSWFFSKRY